VTRVDPGPTQVGGGCSTIVGTVSDWAARRRIGWEAALSFPDNLRGRMWSPFALKKRCGTNLPRT